MVSPLLTYFFDLFASSAGNPSARTTEPAPVGEEETSTTPSLDDFLIVRRYLQRFIPRELADGILDAACYWPSVSTEKKDVSSVSAVLENSNNAAMYYFVTPAIPKIVENSQVVSMKIRGVKFTLESHDQGWGGNINYQGTYQGSYTWFEAAIIRNEQDMLPEGVMNADFLDSQAFGLNGLEIESPSRGRWHLQSNVLVSSNPKRHQVAWFQTSEDANHSSVENQSQILIEKGCGTGDGFVNALAPGRRVAVVARAQYPGWKNYVYSVKVEIFYVVE